MTGIKRFTIAALAWVFACGSAYCMDLSRLKTLFITGSYEASIKEGERLLSRSSRNTEGLDELYYYLALSYLKSGNLLRSGDIFEIITDEFPSSEFRDYAALGKADIAMAKEDFISAEDICRGLLNSRGAHDLKAAVYYRLSRVYFKTDRKDEAEKYLSMLKKEFPQSPEAKIEQELIVESPEGIYYTVQVGAFGRKQNASNLVDKLIGKGYPAYLEEMPAASVAVNYRVRVGKLRTHKEASELAQKLSREGYPTKIYP